jgi:tetratricopeptide (TPR) repeat protein
MATEKIKHLEAQLAATVELQQKIDLMNTLAWEYRHSDVSRGFELSQLAYELSQTSGDNHQPYQRGLIGSLVNLAHLHSRKGEFDTALRQFFEALAFCETGPTTPVHIDALHGIGITYRRLSDYANALRYHIEALNIARELHDPVREAQVLSTQGTIYQQTGELAQAVATFQKSIDLAETTGDQRRKALALNNLAMASVASGDHAQARRYGQQSLRITRELGLYHA